MADGGWSRWRSGPRVGRALEASKELHEVTTQAITEGRAMQTAIARKAAGLPMKMPNLSGVASAIDKLTNAIEHDAKEILEEVETVHVKRQEVFTHARGKLSDRRAALAAAKEALDKLDEALGDNGGPTLGDSSGSPEESK